MKFRLVYSGPLPASANKSKPGYAQSLRDHFHPQLEELWRTHVALRRLVRTSRVPLEPAKYLNGPESPFETLEPYPNNPPAGYVDLTATIPVHDREYMPLVRGSLSTTCSLDILFLRKEDPGSLVLQGGDLDNRIKTLFDGLRMPSFDESKKYPPVNKLTYCLLESDTLVSKFNVTTDRLLAGNTHNANEVHLVIEVELNVLQVGSWNVCLVRN